MPLFLADEIQEYLKMQYDIGLDDRLFPVTKAIFIVKCSAAAKTLV